MSPPVEATASLREQMAGRQSDRSEARDVIAGRRRFLQQLAGAGASLALPGLLQPRFLQGAPLTRKPPTRARAQPVRVRGRVVAAGEGLAGVAVTDGLQIVDTNGDGTFELISDSRQPFVYLTLPAGYRIPQQARGTARFFQPIETGSADGSRGDAGSGFGGDGAPGGEATAEAIFELEKMDVSDEHHTALVMADPQTQNDYEMRLFHEKTVPDVRETLAGLDMPAFGASCGDIMFDDLSLYPDYERAVEKMGVPFFQVIGNHDLNFDALTDIASAATFRRYFGPTYYSFDRGAVHYVVLDDVFWNHDEYFGYLDANQLSWLEQDLSRVEAGRPVVVFIHIPALSTQYRRRDRREPSPAGSITNRAALYRLLEPYASHIISGHTHEMEHVFEGGTTEHIRGTVCGAWWSGPICFDGTPNGYTLFEAQGEEIRWRYKATGHPADYQLRVYPRGSDPEAPDEIVANVWDWDPEWTVVWYEDGIRRGEMARRVGLDPLAVRLHLGEDDPVRREWVEPMPTGHLFYAPVAQAAGDIRVEVTDRWGNVFSGQPEA